MRVSDTLYVPGKKVFFAKRRKGLAGKMIKKNSCGQIIVEGRGKSTDREMGGNATRKIPFRTGASREWFDSKRGGRSRRRKYLSQKRGRKRTQKNIKTKSSEIETKKKKGEEKERDRL